MDTLKAIITKRANQCDNENAGSKKWLSGGELKRLKNTQEKTFTKNENNIKRDKLEAERLQKVIELVKNKRQKAQFDHHHQIDPTTPYNDNDNSSSLNSLQESEKTPTLPKQEVIRILRRLREPITLFGETDRERFQRMCKLQLAKNEDESREGKQNVIIESLAGRDPGNYDNFDDDEDDLAYSKTNNKSREYFQNQSFSTSTSKSGTITDSPENQSFNQSLDKYQSLPQSEKVKLWIKHLLKDWEEELHSRNEEETKSAEGKRASGMHRQTRKDLKPLIKKLKSESLEPDVLEKLSKIVDLCIQRQYREAHDIYMLLSIGNAAWPMGVTMVGIHERAGRSKIFTSEVAHILNDETTRKYIQMFKRLMSFSQRKYPTDPSQMVKIATTNV